MTPKHRQSRVVAALRALPGSGAAVPVSIARDGDLVRAGLVRIVRGGFELTAEGQAFLQRSRL